MNFELFTVRNVDYGFGKFQVAHGKLEFDVKFLQLSKRISVKVCSGKKILFLVKVNKCSRFHRLGYNGFET